MKILIDECLPRRLKKEFLDHSVFTVQEMDWSSKKNGELLKLMVGEFDVFVTVDQNMQFQHSLGQLPIVFVVLIAANNKLETLKPLIPKVLEQLANPDHTHLIEVKAE